MNGGTTETAWHSRPVERVREVPFSSARKRMTVVTDDGTAYMEGGTRGRPAAV
ncbi:MAG: hypothetical protein ABEJ47_01775 [Halorhabdus sp.]